MAMNRASSLLRCTALLAFTVSLTLSKNIERIDVPDDTFQQISPNSLEQPENAAIENALIRYLLTKEWLTRVKSPLPFDFNTLDERQKKRGYWKQCAFNAVSCFGK